MRRKDRQISTAEALEIVDKCAYSVMSMVRADGSPYAVPFSPVRVNDGLYFHCAAKGEKLDALRLNPEVCVVCVGDVVPAADKFTTAYESAIIRGRAGRVTGEDEKKKALCAICRRYTPENMAAFDKAIERSLARTDVWRIAIESVTGKRKKLK